MLLAGCSPIVDPAKACDDPKTVKQIFSVFEDQLAEKADNEGATGFKSAMKNLGLANILSFGSIRLLKVNAYTKSITCSANLDIVLPENYQKISSNTNDWMLYYSANKSDLDDIGLKDGRASLSFDFSIQPTGNGTTFVYKLDHPDKLFNALIVIANLQTLSMKDQNVDVQAYTRAESSNRADETANFLYIESPSSSP